MMLKIAKGHPQNAIKCQKRISGRREKGYAVFGDTIKGRNNQLSKVFTDNWTDAHNVLCENRVSIDFFKKCEQY